MQTSASKTVFILDDEPGTVSYLDGLFSTFFPDIVVAGSAQNLESACLQIAHSKPDLILVDIELSGQSGFDLPFHLKAWIPELKPVFLFISADEKYGKLAINHPGSFFLSKPIQIQALKDIIARLSE